MSVGGASALVVGAASAAHHIIIIILIIIIISVGGGMSTFAAAGSIISRIIIISLLHLLRCSLLQGQYMTTTRLRDAAKHYPSHACVRLQLAAAGSVAAQSLLAAATACHPFYLRDAHLNAGDECV